jgi:hypothetical protein
MEDRNNSEDGASVVTAKGKTLVYLLREEAARLGLPDLEKATDAELKRLAHVLPPEIREDAEEKDVVVELIRLLIQSGDEVN